ncbi:MAG: AAA-like domain-containing protein, partial [Anaerolineae bacterium]
MNFVTGNQQPESNFFVAGGPLPAGSPAYVTRPADEALAGAVRAGEFCAVFAPRHVGKSSLMLHAAGRLQQEGFKTAAVDLTAGGADVDAGRLYRLLLNRLGKQLNLKTDPSDWWEQQTGADAPRRLVGFLEQVVLAEVNEPVVLFVDGINPTLNTDFFDGLCAVARAANDGRAAESSLGRLRVVFLGLAPPTDLPFDFGQRISLQEFTVEQAQPLTQGFTAATGEEKQRVFNRIFYWTNGHPYLTQKLCLTIARMWDKHWTDERIDSLIDRLRLSTVAQNDPHLEFVSHSIQTNPRRRKLLTLYRRLHNGKTVSADGASPAKTGLQQLGLVRGEQGKLKIHNRLYREIFDRRWIKSSMPFNWRSYAIAGALLLALLLAEGFGLLVQQKKQKETQGQALVTQFENAASSEERLASLAGLFSLGGYEERARQLFFEELDPDEQVALFDLNNPRGVSKSLVTVVKGIYVAPNLLNSPHNNTLLKAMTQPLYQVENASSLGAIELDLEITQWLRGRTYYNSQNQYQRAVDTFSVAISINKRNPGTYFDRGLAYAALGQPTEALADFETVLDLDERWQSRVQQALVGDAGVYAALWREQREYKSLIALAPTPT